MPLRISLKARERLIINGAVIRNGGRMADLLIETACQFLRESEIIHESEADTPVKKLCVTLQVIHLADDPTDAKALLLAQSAEVLQIMPSAAPFLLEIQDWLARGYTYSALRSGRHLMYHERDLMVQRSEGVQAA